MASLNDRINYPTVGIKRYKHNPRLPLLDRLQGLPGARRFPAGRCNSLRRNIRQRQRLIPQKLTDGIRNDSTTKPFCQRIF